MKRRQLLRKIRDAAKEAGIGYSEHELTRHSGITVGNTSTTIPRHIEIHDRLAEAIYKQLEVELGKGWWRK